MTTGRWSGGWRHAAVIAAAYTAIAVVMTWPLAANLPRRIAADMADPVFICWVLMWTGGQVLSALRGDPHALAQYWNGNIFYPDARTVAYSEHFTPQMLQILPVYAATGNIVLAYNLLFLSTFVLCALAVYWLVRDLTGVRAAAFVAGLAFAYSPYRLGQLSHLQVLSSQWMPLAVLGFRRYFATRRAAPLAGGAAAWLVQNLSCGYYLLFFSPFLAAYCAYEMIRRRLLRDWRVWLSLAAATMIVGALTWPFVKPYLDLRAATGLGSRTLDEIVSYSSDAHAFATAPVVSRLWGQRLRGHFKTEGIGFFGVTTLALAAIGVGVGMRASWRAGGGAGPARRRLIMIAAAAATASAIVLVWTFAAGSLTIRTAGTTIILRNAKPLLELFAVSIAAFALLWPRVRRLDAPGAGWNIGYWSMAVLLSAVFALGPRVEALGHRLGPGPYLWLVQYVPGFDGLRVPSRLLMLTSLFLAVLTGIGLAAMLVSARRRVGSAIAVACSAAILAEAWMVPMPVNTPLNVAPLARVPNLATGRRISPLYRIIEETPAPAVVIEFPFGEPAYDLQAAFYAGYHRKPIVNGYSGFFPDDYAERARTIGQLPDDPSPATAMLRASGATLALVHEDAYRTGLGRQISTWLLSLGARPLGAQGGDRLFALQ